MKWKRKLWLSCLLTTPFHHFPEHEGLKVFMYLLMKVHLVPRVWRPLFLINYTAYMLWNIFMGKSLKTFKKARIVLELVFSNLNNMCNIFSTTSSCSPFQISATASFFCFTKILVFLISHPCIMGIVILRIIILYYDMLLNLSLFLLL